MCQGFKVNKKNICILQKVALTSVDWQNLYAKLNSIWFCFPLSSFKLLIVAVIDLFFFFFYFMMKSVICNWKRKALANTKTKQSPCKTTVKCLAHNTWGKIEKWLISCFWNSAYKNVTRRRHEEKIITENLINKTVSTIKVIYLLLITRGLNWSCKKWICAAKDSRNTKAKENGAGFRRGEVVINRTYSFLLLASKKVLPKIYWN